MQPNINPQTQSRTEKLPALLEIVLWISQYEKKINRILFTGYHSVFQGTLWNEKETWRGKDYSINGIGTRRWPWITPDILPQN